MYAKHLTKCHSSDIDSDGAVVDMEAEVSDDVNLQQTSLGVGVPDDTEMDIENHSKITKSQLRDIAALFICEAKSKISTLSICAVCSESMPASV